MLRIYKINTICKTLELVIEEKLLVVVVAAAAIPVMCLSSTYFIPSSTE
jgi:hypothetical protein